MTSSLPLHASAAEMLARRTLSSGSLTWSKRTCSLSAGVPAEEQRLTFGGRQLADGAALAECGVTDEATLFSLARLLGGGKKRKKKTYTKPKKIKHKHKKIKLRVLKFYKVGLFGSTSLHRGGFP